MKLSNDTPEKTTASLPVFQVTEEEVADKNRDVSFENMPSDTFELSYACMLIPRFPAHQLVGDLTEYLPQWLLQICVSGGWRLEYHNIRPQYLSWILSVPASVSPNRFMEIIREQTSEFVLSNFGSIQRENLSSDFWAPGYLVVSGSKPIPDEMMEQYIDLTRRHQGLCKLQDKVKGKRDQPSHTR